jgi:hypothetical protein
MQTEIKCELMDEWDFDHCFECKRFSRAHGKGLNNWRCKLNNENAKERRDFGMIWAIFYLHEVHDLKLPEVKVTRVRKWKKG